METAHRKDLAQRARSTKTRIVFFSEESPIDWRPGTVRNPDTGEPFTEAAAWELIALKLEGGHPVETIPLRKPPNKMAEMMLIDLEAERPKLYVKFQVGSNNLVGRSFHYSKYS